MARPRSMRNLIGVFKDKISIVKATLVLAKRPISTYHIAVLRATTHDPSTPPPDYIIEDFLTLGLQSRSTAAVFIDALMNRLHGTGDVFVALKCLITIHNIIQRGCAVFRDQISHYPTNGGHNFLNLSTFRDGSGPDWRELSGWVKWYAGVIERSLIVSRVLGFYLTCPPPRPQSSEATVNRKGRVTGYSNFELLKELNSLVVMVEEISNAPESLHYQRISSIYEVMKLVGEDYRMAMREVSTILSELEVRMEERLSAVEMASLLSDLKGLESRREKLVLMFLNKKKNDGVWEMISGLRENVERRESLRSVRGVENRGRGGCRSESNQLMVSDERVIGRRSESWELLLPAPSASTNPWEVLLPTPSACTNPWWDVVDQKRLTIYTA